MKIASGKNKLKATAVILCAAITAGTLTYVNNDRSIIMTEAMTVDEIEAEKAQNQKEINELQQNIDSLKGDLAEQEAYQKQLQEKIDLQNANLDNVNTIINDLNIKIDEKREKIDQLQNDIAQKEKDIEDGLELFKDRLRAMYISGNDSLASALVGATDFYDMLSKIELISQVAKHDDELIDSLNTQLSQYKEAQAQLDIEMNALNSDLSAQEENRKEYRAAMEELQADYEESADYIARKEADIASQQRDVKALEADNNAMDDEIKQIQDEIERQRQQAIALDEERNENNYSDDDYSDDDYSDDDSGSSGGGDTTQPSSGGGGFSGALSWPVPGFYGVSSGYGYRWGSFHNGMDIAGGGIAGATVTAASSGTVIVAKSGCTHNYGKDGSCGCGGGYGNYVVIDHGDGISTLYGHCASICVSVGQYVSAGEAIGYVGSTGWSTGNHLHFEVMVNGSKVDPTGYLY